MAKDIAVLEDVSGMDANAIFDAVGERDACVPIRHAGLDLARATQRGDGASKLGQQTVAGSLDDAAVMGGESPGRSARRGSPEAVRASLCRWPRSVASTRHIGRDDGGKTPDGAHSSGIRALRPARMIASKRVRISGAGAKRPAKRATFPLKAAP
jgi:hypothetical protein